jgi:hypothetical protein
LHICLGTKIKWDNHKLVNSNFLPIIQLTKMKHTILNHFFLLSPPV